MVGAATAGHQARASRDRDARFAGYARLTESAAVPLETELTLHELSGSYF